MHTLLCVCPPRVGSLLPLVLLKSCSLIPLDFKVWFSRNSSSRCQTPKLGSLMVGLRTFTPVGGLLWYKCSPVCESPTQQLWYLVLLWLHPSYHLIVASPLSLDVWYLFWWVPVSSCRWLSAASCDSVVLTRGSESTSFYSAILVPPSNISLLIYFITKFNFWFNLKKKCFRWIVMKTME